ncbi:hypothetical protein GFS24_18170 [Chitinophaga sp. SYP-B3965]|uniref:hypothetical protein n=1 Tax=Chitinophaga sp. SYP-B3965 TaxID=2663120 RepID=UPI001299E331|nr:hypothetical protein [Chitinophaga sp. SYP-B3965]MRG47055.1 hypothetical protein [Chitinophaga sp. SYP-B3965]
MRKPLFSLIVIALFFSSCKKDDDPAAENWYLTRLIDVYEARNDTTFISYNADNTFKESRFSYIHNDAPAFNAFGAVYEGDKITGIQMWSNSMPERHTITSIQYTGNLVTIADQEVYDREQAKWVINSHDSLVYAGGKLAELYANYKNGSTTFYKLTWEGDNVKSYECYSKQTGTEYVLFQTFNYTYDAKPAFHRMLTGNYYWLADITNFTYLSANNVTKADMIRQPEGTVETSRTNTFIYNGEGLLTSIATREESVYLESAKNYTTVLEYTKR